MTYEDRPVSVTNPAHYRSHPSGVECIDIVRDLPFNVGNAIKYLWRAGDKGGPKKLREDLEKALWYIQDSIDNPGSLINTPLINIELVTKWSEAEGQTTRRRIITFIVCNLNQLAKQELEAWLADIDDMDLLIDSQ